MRRGATRLAAVVIAHADPAQVRRLIRALEGVRIYLHCDAATPTAVFREMIEGLPDRVTVLERRRTQLASWSLVEAELAGLRAALATSAAQHIAVLSGADYPLASMDSLYDELAPWEGQTYAWNVPLPFPAWDTPRHPDGGLWRLHRRFIRRGAHIVHWRGIPLRWPVPRRVPADVELRASSHWKILSRHHAAELLRIVDTRPDLVRFWRSSLVPEETFVASVLASPALVGEGALAPCAAQPWFIDWPGPGAHHPRWLADADFDRLAEARRAAPATPRSAFGMPAGGDLSARKLFARKFSSRQTALLDRIDEELRS